MKGPVSLIMECLINKKWGHGVDPANIDREAFEKLEYTPINIPKIDHEEELQKLRDHIAANPNGGPLDHFDKDCSEIELSPEQLAVKTIRAKVSELNAAIEKASEFGIKVEIDSMSSYQIATGETTHLTATISKTL